MEYRFIDEKDFCIRSLIFMPISKQYNSLDSYPNIK